MSTQELIEKYNNAFYNGGDNLKKILGEFAAELQAREATQHTLVVSRDETDSFVVHLKSNPKQEAFGVSIHQAIGNWTRLYHGALGVEIEYNKSCRH